MSKRLSLLGIFLGVAACGGDKITPVEQPPPVTLESLALTLELPTMFEVSQTQPFVVEGHYSDGHTQDLALYVEITVDGDAIRVDRQDGLKVIAVKPGTATLKVNLEGTRAEASVTVLPAHLTSLEIAGESAIGRDLKGQLTASGHFADGTTVDVTNMVTWTSASPNVATITASGEITALHSAGTTEITAELDSVRATFALTVECRYPVGAPTTMLAYETLPNMSWDAVYMGDGTSRPFSLEAYHCSEEFADSETIIMTVMAGWCVYCPDMVQRIASIGNDLEAAGATMLWIEVEDEQGRSVHGAYANNKVNEDGGQNFGFRISDGDTMPQPEIIRSSPLITQFPSVYVFRKRDMKMIANGPASDFYLPLLDIVQHPEWNWHDPQNPVESFESKCAEGQEESSEPNDSLVTAAPLTGATAFGAGICTDAPDYYEIAIAGTWRVTIQFTNTVGNLDLDIWDKATGRPLVVGGYPAGSTSTNHNSEAYEGTGPAVVRVFGANGASAPYTLYLETL